MKIEFTSLSHVGLIRDINQDTILELPDLGCFLVADGMGGEQAGEEASAQVAATLQRDLEAFFRTSPDSPKDIEHALRQAFSRANQDVRQIAQHEPAKSGLGSTGSLLCLHRGIHLIAHVGDSRIYRFRNGEARLLTRDHTLVWMLYEQGAISRVEMETHPERHLLTQCIGSPKDVNVDLLEDRVEAGDLFLLCSDGLTGYAPERRIFEIVADQDRSLQERTQQLIDEALGGGGGDNVTVMLVRVARLDEQDTWQPEATAPLTQFTGADDETVVDEELRPQRPAAPPGRLGPRRWIPPVLIILALVSWIVALSITSRRAQLEVVLHPTGSAGLKQLHVSGRGTRSDPGNPDRSPYRLETRSIPVTEAGFRFTLPFVGHWDLTLEAPGRVPWQIDVPPDPEVASIELYPWQDCLPVRVKNLPPPERVQWVRVYKRGSDVDDPLVELKPPQLREAEVTLWLPSGGQYVLKVRGVEGGSFIDPGLNPQRGDQVEINVQLN